MSFENSHILKFPKMTKIKEKISFLIILPILIHSTDVCWDKFDSNLRNQCSRGEWQQRYFYDHASMTCQLFWFDGCKTSSRNMFDDLLTCQWLCEEEPRYKTRACLEVFDEHYRDECNGGLWRQNYYFDKQKMRCVPFWYDGCKGTSANLFPDLSSCLQTCEMPVGEVKNQQANLDKSSMYRPFTNAPSNQQHTHPHRHHAQRPTQSRHQYPVTHSPKVQMDRPNAKIYDGNSEDSKVKSTTMKPSENICEYMNPCQNNGTCVYDKLKKTYFCECVDGYTNKNCTELDDRDPCAKHPCKNGATCINKPDKEKLEITFDCFCALGFGGIRCEEKPCDPNPCKNNGTCRTTKGEPPFFCDCSSEWGGNNCEVEIPNKNNRKYGKNVQLLSSGKPEWIEDLRKHKMREGKPSKSSMEIFTGDGTNYTEPDNDLHLLNGTDKQNLKSRTLRLPAGSGDPSSESIRFESNCLTTLFFGLLLFISTFLFLNA